MDDPLDEMGQEIQSIELHFCHPIFPLVTFCDCWQYRLKRIFPFVIVSLLFALTFSRVFFSFPFHLFRWHDIANIFIFITINHRNRYKKYKRTLVGYIWNTVILSIKSTTCKKNWIIARVTQKRLWPVMQLNVMRYLTYQKGKKGDALHNKVAKYFLRED